MSCPFLNGIKHDRFQIVYFPISYIDIHVANQTTIFITDPDLEEDSSQTIEYDLEDERAEIEATCTGYGGKPEPTFRW